MSGIILLNETAECAVFFSERLSPASYLYWKLTRALHSYFRACLLNLAGAPTLAPSPGRSTVQWSIFMAGEIESERGIFRGNEK